MAFLPNDVRMEGVDYIMDESAVQVHVAPEAISFRFEDWTTKQVVKWLKGLGFYSEIFDAFKRQGITGQDLLSLNDDILKDELGITAFGSRSRLLKQIALLQTTSAESSDFAPLSSPQAKAAANPFNSLSEDEKLSSLASHESQKAPATAKESDRIYISSHSRVPRPLRAMSDVQQSPVVSSAIKTPLLVSASSDSDSVTAGGGSTLYPAEAVYICDIRNEKRFAFIKRGSGTNPDGSLLPHSRCWNGSVTAALLFLSAIPALGSLLALTLLFSSGVSDSTVRGLAPLLSFTTFAGLYLLYRVVDWELRSTTMTFRSGRVTLVTQSPVRRWEKTFTQGDIAHVCTRVLANEHIATDAKATGGSGFGHEHIQKSHAPVACFIQRRNWSQWSNEVLFGPGKQFDGVLMYRVPILGYVDEIERRAQKLGDIVGIPFKSAYDLQASSET